MIHSRMPETGETTKPTALLPEFDPIPDILKAIPQWVVWAYRRRENGSWTKPPINPRTGKNASSDDPSTWTTFDVAVSAYRSGRYDGVGFMLTDDCPFAGVDLDDCRDPDTGEIADGVWEIIDALDSYTEISPSGTGVKIWVEGTLPSGGTKRGPIELYDRDRYFTVTGLHLPEMPTTIEARQEALATLHEQVAWGCYEDGEDGNDARHEDEGKRGPSPDEIDAALGGPITPRGDLRRIGNRLISTSNAIHDPIPPHLCRLLETTGPDGHPSASEADMAVLTAMAWRVTPSETYSLFVASPRGKDLLLRKSDANLRRSIGVAYIIANKGKKNRKRKPKGSAGGGPGR